jgi:hypothetical protein
MCTKQRQRNIALFQSHHHNTNNTLFTFFNDAHTQQQHKDMPQNADIVGHQYIAINIANVWYRDSHMDHNICK